LRHPETHEETTVNPNVPALLREREHYERNGNVDRAAQVTAVLESLGYNDPEVPETTATGTPPERATPPRPRKKA
jgi:hypothetical protein